MNVTPSQCVEAHTLGVTFAVIEAYYKAEPLQRGSRFSSASVTGKGQVDRRDSQEVKQQQTHSATRATVGNRRTAMKVLQRKSQGMVLVYELEPSVVNAGPPLLVFESVTRKAQIENFPSNWRALTDDELIAISRTKQSD